MLFVGIWQFREAIIQREAEYLARGGRLLFPLPQVEVIDGVREHLGARSDTAAIG
jgi:hypothetical protein